MKKEKDLKEDILENEPSVDEDKKESIVVEDYQAQIDELNNKYLMALAEQKNYKKRCDDEMEKFYKYASFNVCKEMIKILDSFDFALDKVYENEEINKFLDGFKITRNQIFNVLEKEGVKEIEALNKEYDPNLMISIGQETDESKKNEEVLKVLMKGYMYKDTVLRPSTVIINDNNK